MSALESLIEDTLAQVNVAREAFGYPRLNDLPDARPGDTKDCLFFRAMKDMGCTGVGGSGQMSFASERMAQAIGQLWGVEAQGNQVPAPAQFGRVISEFDHNGTGYYNV